MKVILDADPQAGFKVEPTKRAERHAGCNDTSASRANARLRPGLAPPATQGAVSSLNSDTASAVSFARGEGAGSASIIIGRSNVSRRSPSARGIIMSGADDPETIDEAAPASATP